MAFVSGLFLAAGLSERMGKQKLLLQLPKGPAIEYSLKNLLFSRVDEIVIVTGLDGKIKEAATSFLERFKSKKTINFAENPNPAAGMASSINIGLQRCSTDADGILFMLADLPFVSEDIINSVIESFAEDPEMNTVPFFSGKQGHPVVISKRWRSLLSAGSGDFGGRRIIREHPEATKKVHFPSDRPLMDIDTEQDYQKVLNTPDP